MKKTQFIVAHTFRQAEQYAREQKLQRNEYVVLTDMNKLRGIAADTMEFILLDYYWENEFFKEEQPFYKFLLAGGAKETRVYSEPR